MPQRSVRLSRGAMARSETLVSLRQLYLGGSPITDAGADIASSSGLPALTDLHLRGSRITDAGAGAGRLRRAARVAGSQPPHLSALRGDRQGTDVPARPAILLQAVSPETGAERDHRPTKGVGTDGRRSTRRLVGNRARLSECGPVQGCRLSSVTLNTITPSRLRKLSCSGEVDGETGCHFAVRREP